MIIVLNKLNLLDILFIVLCLCFLIEQVYYFVLGSYPYRYGFIVKTIFLPRFDINYWDSIKNKIKTMRIKACLDKNEVYMKYKYPSLVIGPSLFIGQIRSNNSGAILHIKIGPISALFVLFLFIYPFLSYDILEDTMFQMMNILILIGVIVYFYFRLSNSINGLIQNEISK
jgi:hypothetical protein